MSSSQIAIALGVVAISWLSRDIVRSLMKSVFPQGLPGEKNTALLATARSASADPATAEDLKDAVEYDYIIVGTGTAGCVLASRLSEDPSKTVLAIEAGHSDVKQLMSRMPAGLAQLFNTAADWAFKTVPQPGCNGREISWPRGRMIGGCSSINAMLYTKGSADDYDEWERLGNVGWGFRNVSKYMRRAEKFRQPKDAERRITSEDLTDHGKDGPWEIGYSYRSEISNPFNQACNSIGIKQTSDINTDRGIKGASYMQVFIDEKGQRASTAVAYLTKDVVRRPNLKIASGQIVTKVIFDTSGTEPRAIGIEMAASKSATTRYLAKARKEVILCSGSVCTPQLLKLSGVGPAKELSDHKIPLVKDLPGVGENLMDHMAYHGVVFKTDKEASMHYIQQPLKGLAAIIEWLRHGTGPMSSNACDAAAFVRSADRDDAPASLTNPDRSSGVGSVDLELFLFNLCFADHGAFVAPLTDGYAHVSTVGLRPESRGTIKLASNDPFALPIIDPRVFSTDYDVDVLLYGTKLATKIARSDPYKKYFKGWYIGPHFPIDWDTASDEEIKIHIRNTSDTIYHPMGTAKMGKDPEAVVDDQLRVHGVQSLRVVDASIFPTPLACHPCAPVVMVAEKAADLIKSSGH